MAFSLPRELHAAPPHLPKSCSCASAGLALEESGSLLQELEYFRCHLDLGFWMF